MGTCCVSSIQSASQRMWDVLGGEKEGASATDGAIPSPPKMGGLGYNGECRRSGSSLAADLLSHLKRGLRPEIVRL